MPIAPKRDILKLPDPTRAARRSLALFLLLVLAFVLWAWIGPKLVRSHLVVDVADAAHATDWTCTWTQSASGEVHGSYLGVEPDAPRVLEIEVSGKPQAGGNTFDFWLYDVRSDTGHKPDLVALLDRGQNPDFRGWKPFDQGPGITYYGARPGRLSVPVEGRHARLAIAKTRFGGPIKVSFRGYTIEESSYSPTTVGATIIVPPILATWPEGKLEQRLPVYPLRDVSITWKAEPAGPVSFSDRRVEFRIGKCTLFRRALTPGGPELTPAGEGRWQSAGEKLELEGDFRPGALVYVAGVLAVYVLLLALAGAVLVLRRVLPRVASSRCTPPLLAALLVIVVHAAVAMHVPVQITSDGMDYLDAADHLARTGTFERFPLYKAPGLSVLIAGAMVACDDFLGAFAWMQAGLAVLMSLAAYALVRARAGRGWAIAAGVVVGIHPSLITYETHLLRELPSAAVMTILSLAIIRVRDGLAKGDRDAIRCSWWWTIALALLCAAGAYLRENLQVLVPLVPLILLLPGAGTWKQRALRAATVLVLSFACLTPRGMVLYRVYGTFSMVSPKIQGNRLLASWVNLIADANDPALLTREQYVELRGSDLASPLSDYDFSGWVLRKSRLSKPARSESGDWITSEEVAKDFLDETTARAPLRALGTSIRAFASQLGLWNIQTGRMKTYAASDEFYSSALRGERVPFATNYSPGTLTVLNADRMKANAAAIQDVITRSRRSIKFLEDRPATRLFNEWFYAFRAVRPIASWLFLAGVLIALLRRDVALAGIGAIVLLSTFGAAFVVGTPTDRFGVPFIPLIWCIGLIAAAHFAHRRSCATSARATP
jgi:hypothetical protein